MNDDLQTYIEPELEARIVALVLGESSAFEAEELERLISERPELQLYRTGLEKIHGVVSDAHREQDEEEWKLSDDRRGKIQAKIEERKRHEMVEARRKRISGIAQRRLIYTCAASLVLTLVIVVLSQPLKSQKDEASLVAYSAKSEENSYARSDVSGGSRFVVPLEGVQQLEGDILNDTAVARLEPEASGSLSREISEALAELDDSTGHASSGVIEVNGRTSVVDRTVRREIPEEPGESYAYKVPRDNQKASIGRPDPAPKSEMRQAKVARKTVEKKPASPAQNAERMIAANSTGPTSVPVPTLEAPGSSADFVDGSDFGDGFGAGWSDDKMAERERRGEEREKNWKGRARGRDLDLYGEEEFAKKDEKLADNPFDSETEKSAKKSGSKKKKYIASGNEGGRKPEPSKPSAPAGGVVNGGFPLTPATPAPKPVPAAVTAPVPVPEAKPMVRAKQVELQELESLADLEKVNAVNEEVSLAKRSTEEKKEQVDRVLQQKDQMLEIREELQRSGSRLLAEEQMPLPDESLLKDMTSEFELGAVGGRKSADPSKGGAIAGSAHSLNERDGGLKKNLSSLLRADGRAIAGGGGNVDPFSVGGDFDHGGMDPFDGDESDRSNFFAPDDADADPFASGGDPDPFVSNDADGDEARSQWSFEDAKKIPLYAEVKTKDVEASENLNRLNQIIIPEIKLENTTVEEAVEFLKSRTAELDVTTLDESKKGVDFKVRNPVTLSLSDGDSVEDEDGLSAPVDPGQTVIKNLNLKNVPANVALQYIADEAKLRYKVDGEGVTLLPLSSGESDDLLQRRWDLSPAAVAEIREATANGKSFETILKENGVSFMENTGVSFLADDNTLIVRNSPTNLELVDSIVVAAEDLAKKKAKNREKEWLLGEDQPEDPNGESAKVSPAKSKPVEVKKEKTAAPFETSTAEKTDSTFSLNVSDVSFKLAKAALGKGNWPDASKVRPEEFVNALDYDDSKPTQAAKISCEIEQGSHPFMQQRNLMRVSMSTASLGRNAATPLRLTILLDQSGSMERADRAKSLQRAFALLAAQLTPNDEVTLVGFARTPRLLAERVKGDQVAKLAQIVANPVTEGGTNLEEALSSGLQLAKQQFLKGAQNRIILLTDGAANLGDAKPANLSSQVASMRRADIAFDACGVGADGLNDDVLSSLAKQGDGRYYFLDRPEDADDGFARQIAGALRPAAKNVKVQVLFNPERVSTFKLYGFEKHKLKKEDFRNDSVDAAEMAAEESGVALYHFEPMPEGRGDVGTVSVRFLDTATNRMVERTWAIPYEEESLFFSKADPKLRLASVAGLFAEKLKGSPVGDRVELKKLRQEMQLLKPTFGNQYRFNEFQNMLQQAGD